MVALAIGIGLGVGFGLYQLQVSGFDGDAYWNAGLRLRDGLPLYYDGVPNDPLVYRYPPWFAWLWVPLTYLPHDAVMAVWRVAMVAAALTLLTLRTRWLWLFLPSLVAAGWMGNVQPAVVALAVYGMTRPWMLGAADGIKALPLLLVGRFAWERKWRAVAIATSLSAVLWATLFTANWQDYPTLRPVWPLTDLALLLALRRHVQLDDAKDGRTVAVARLNSSGIGGHSELDGKRV